MALPASAAFYVGDTTAAPSFNLALFDLSGLSAVGTEVAYDGYGYSVTASSDYSFHSFVRGAFAGVGEWDQFLFLYQDSLDSTAALNNGVIAIDDFNGTVGLSGFDVALSTSVAYYLVTTGSDLPDSG
jgi:hypothetical protein